MVHPNHQPIPSKKHNMKGARKVTLDGIALLLHILKDLGFKSPQVTLVFCLLFFLVLLVPACQMFV